MENNITPTITLAKLYESQNQLIDAIQIYTKLLELNPSDEIKTKVESLSNKIYTRIVKDYNRQINTIFSKFELKYFKILPNKELSPSSETTEIDKENDIPKETKKRKKTRKSDEDLKAKNTESESEDIEKITPASFHYAETGPASPASVKSRSKHYQIRPDRTPGLKREKEKKESISKEPVLHNEIQEIINGKYSQVEKVETLTQKEEVQKDIGEKQESTEKKPVLAEDIVKKSDKVKKQPEESKEEQIQNESQETAVVEQVIEKDVEDEKKKSNDIKAVLKELNEIKETISKDREIFFTKMYEIDKKLKEIEIDEIKEVINLDKKSDEKEKDK